MKIGIVQFPGSNCERETILAVKRAEMEPIEYLWNEPREKLEQMDGYVIVGGFSYEDRSRAGIIAALDPVMEAIKAQSEKGKPILGICNGAQILVETGLVPGLENNKLAMVLTENKRIAAGKVLGTGYYNAWVWIRLSPFYQRNAFTRYLNDKTILSMPVAHAEGRFMMSDALWREIEQQGLHVFQYCDASGTVQNCFPVNPNGSQHNIAAISNKAGNVMAMMPHPERTQAGDLLFHSMRDYIRAGHVEKVAPLYYYPRAASPAVYKRAAHSDECIIGLIITDNQALTVQQTLRANGLPVTVKRYIHWEIGMDAFDEHIIHQIKKSGVLYNERKETVISPETLSSTDANVVTFLVRMKEEIVGLQKRQILAEHFGVKGIRAIQQSVLWQFSSERAMIPELKERILKTNIIHNTYAQDCYDYAPSNT